MKIDPRVIKDYFKNNIELFIIPIIFLSLVLIIKWIWGVFELPTQDDLIILIQSFFTTYGIWVIFLAAIMESMLFLGWYFPGSLVIFLGVASTNGNPELAIKNIFAVCIGMTIGYSINYLIGRFGWYRVFKKLGFMDEIVKIENRLKAKGILHSFFLYVMPGLGSLLSTAFGVLKYPFPKFISFTILMVIFWNTAWGTLVYFFGMPLFKTLTSTVGIFIVFCFYFYYVYNKKKEDEKNIPQNQKGDAE